MVVLDDSVFALYRFVPPSARPAPRILAAIYPRSGRRETLTVQDLGLAATTLNRNPATLRHVMVTGGAAGDVHPWGASDGRLMKIEIPARHLSVERLPPALPPVLQPVTLPRLGHSQGGRGLVENPRGRGADLLAAPPPPQGDAWDTVLG